MKELRLRVLSKLGYSARVAKMTVVYFDMQMVDVRV